MTSQNVETLSTVLGVEERTSGTLPEFERFVAYAQAQSASDIHLTIGMPPLVRIAGDLVAIPGEAALTSDQVTLTAKYLAGDRWEDFDGDLDCRAGVGGVLMRVNIFGEIRGLGVSIRLINATPPELTDLGLPPVVSTLADKRDGIILLCGITGSGKSTTLAGMVNWINHRKALHIITIEDPIEYVFTPDVALIHQREVDAGGHGHTTGFARALRSSLREDPDVILVGEMRDAETIESALTAAETGHLVLATLHAGSADQAPDRIIDALPADKQNQARAQLAATLEGVIVQSLVPAATGRRRVCVAEIMVVNTAARAMIREGRTHQLRSVIEGGGSEGMISFDASLAQAVVEKRISPEEATRWARNEDDLRDWVQRMRAG